MSVRSKKSRSKRWESIEVPAIDELELLSDAEIEKHRLPDGFCVRFFCHDMRHLYTVASTYVTLTRGVLDYLHDYNQLGPNKSRNKLFLCTQHNKEGKCLNGPYCREIHCTLPIEKAEEATMYGVPSNATGAPNAITIVEGNEIIEKGLNKLLQSGSGVATSVEAAQQGGDGAAPEAPVIPSVFDSIFASEGDDSASALASETPLNDLEPSEPQTPAVSQLLISMPAHTILRHSLHSRWTSKSMYDTLPAGVTFLVALPNTPTPVDEYDSSALFVTRGAKEYYEQQIRNEPSTVTMQHCAHYSKNGICCFGEDCQFVHVLHYRAKDRDGADGSCSEMESSVASGSTAPDRRPNAGKARRAKETPLCIDVPDSKGTVAGGRGHRGKPSTGPTSRSSSAACSSVTANNGASSGPAPTGNALNANCVFVPDSAQWVAQQQQLLMQAGQLNLAHAQAHASQLPFSPGNMQKLIMYQNAAMPTSAAHLLQHQLQQQQQQQQQPFSIVQGPSGEFFFVPNMVQASAADLSAMNINMLPSPFS